VRRRYDQGVRVRDAVDGQVDDEGCPRRGGGAGGGQDEVVQGLLGRSSASLWRRARSIRERRKYSLRQRLKAGHDEAAESEGIGSQPFEIHPVGHGRFWGRKLPTKKTLRAANAVA
jgi:hypothetical protein